MPSVCIVRFNNAYIMQTTRSMINLSAHEPSQHTIQIAKSEHESNEKEVIITYDFLGRNVNYLHKSGIHLVKYNDGSVEKKYVLRH